MFTSILGDLSSGLTIMEGAACTAAAMGLGCIISYAYQKQGPYTKNFTVTLAVLPTLLQFVIMMVNGNMGTGVAVVGAFSLVRFRSIPGSSREITFIFFAMAIGLSIGMGYISFAVFMTAVVSVFSYLLHRLPFGFHPSNAKELKVWIPEHLDYTEIFDDIFLQYTKQAELIKVKTVQLGSMLEAVYHIELKEGAAEKQMLDELRCRNGNLSIICARRQAVQDEL